MLPIKQQLSNYNHYDGGNSIEYIVLHDTGNANDTAEGNANYFCGGDRGASAHYFVDDDSIVQVVKDTDGAWHCGDGAGKYGITNRNSIGIEQCRVNNSVTATTEANTLELVKFLMAKYNVPIEKVVRHYDASRKNCPSSFNTDGQWTRWNNFKAKLGGTTPVATAPVIPSGLPVLQKGSQGDAVKDLQTRLNKVGKCGLVVDGSFGSGTDGAVRDFQSKNGLSVDGVVGNQTWTKLYTICFAMDDPMADGSLSKGEFGNAVRTLQTKLNRLGYNLAVDGDFGTNTENAVKDFQSKNGLTVDGYAGNQTLSKLDAVIAELDKPKIDYETQLCRIFDNDVKVIALTGKTKCINYAKDNCKGHVKIQCVADSAWIAEFDIVPPAPPVVEPPKVEPVPEPPKPVVHPIMGVAEVEVGQAETYLHKVNPDAPFYAQIYKEEGELEGVRWDIAFAQSIKETNWFRFGGDVLVEQNNFAGIGTVGGGVRGNYFPDARTGIKAQIQHLKAYASTEALKGECIDPRFKYVSRGIAPNIEDLGSGKWASDTDNYGGKIWLAVEAIKATVADPNCKPAEPKPPVVTPEPPVEEKPPVVITPPVIEPQPEPETPVTPEEPKVEEPKKNWLLELFKVIVKAIVEYFEGKKE